MIARGLAVGAVLVGSLVTDNAARQDDGACSRLEPVALGGTVTEPKLIELSGLAGSRQWSDVLWGHNDSGGAPELYAFAEDGTSLGTYPVEGAEAVDWEDIATGPDPSGRDTVLYIGDIGDNDAVRPSVTVYRVYEPGERPIAPGSPLTEVEAIELTYPDGPADAEALLIDPSNGDLIIVTKSLTGASRVLVAPAASLVAGDPVTMTDAGGLSVPLASAPGGGLPGTMVTGGDVSPDGSLVALRTYRSVLVFDRDEDQALADALLGDPCFGPQEEEQQGEAIAFTGDGVAYVTASEGANPTIHRVEIAAPVTTTTVRDPDGAGDGASAAEDDDDIVTIGGLLVGAGLLLVVVGGGALWWSRRRGSVAG